jgi:hypothetical protein
MKIFMLYFLLEGATVEHPFYYETLLGCHEVGAILSIPYEGYRCVTDYYLSFEGI